MSGHNKWSKIKHKKATTDAQKSKLFGKAAKVITVESKRCGGDKDDPGLKTAIENAKSVNMPSQNIERAIQRGTDTNAAVIESITYEAYGPGGCAILIDTLTDNRNRTAQEIRHILAEHNTTISAPGSASWAFTRKNGEVTANQTIPLSEEDTKKLETLVSDLLDQDDTKEVNTQNVI